MGKKYRTFLIWLLGFSVLFGLFCIVWPLTHPDVVPPSVQARQADSAKPQISAPATPDDPGTAPAEPAEPPQTSEEPAAQDPQPTEEEKKAQRLLGRMSLEEKIYQLFVVTPESLTGVRTATLAGDTTRQALESQPVGGVVYFAKNLLDRDQTKTLLENTASYCEIAPLLAVDEEGGRVARVGSNPAMGTTSFSDMGDYGDDGDTAAVREIGLTLGEELLELGFNLDFAPVADIVTNPANTEIGRRSFSSDPQVASDMVRSIVSGFVDAGMPCCLKHFPGHGGTAADTHNGMAVTRRTLEELRQAELLPFSAGMEAGVPMVMVGHLSAVELNGDDTPSDLSAAVVTDLLRKELGFTGVIITDAQNMAAITDHYTAGEAAVQALEAGVDMILMPSDLQEAVDSVLDAVESGQLSEERLDESVVRILAMKYQYDILT